MYDSFIKWCREGLEVGGRFLGPGSPIKKKMETDFIGLTQYC